MNLSTEESKEVSLQTLKKRTRRGFLSGLGAFLMGFAGWTWLRTRAEEEGLGWPFRRVLSWNEKVWRGYFRSDRVPTSPKAPPEGTTFRVNGSEGMEGDFDPSAWRLSVGSLMLSLADIKALPRTEATATFKCIEGWSEEISYAGVKYSDFVTHYQLGTRSGAAPNPATAAADLYPYVGMSTPDEEYYVSLDTESLWHPNTVLAYELNGKPLTEKNGAPLRLIIPVKYGIKNLKRIGSIAFSDTKPPDYWHEQGYDWYAGL